jgi:REP element-mobilizing transposase RayT
LQIVFAVKRRKKLIDPSWQAELNMYISGIITAKGHKSLIVNGVEDHIHIFVGFNPKQTVNELVREIKCNSSKFINEQKSVSEIFRWQEGYGVFSYAQSQVSNVYNYIERQQEHHRKKDYRQEYVAFLEEFEIEYNEKYLFGREDG